MDARAQLTALAPYVSTMGRQNRAMMQRRTDIVDGIVGGTFVYTLGALLDRDGRQVMMGPVLEDGTG